MKNKKILYSLLTIILIAFVCANYSLIHYMNKNDLKLEACGNLPYLRFTSKAIENGNSLQTSVTTNLARVSTDTKFIFKIKYKDNVVRNMVLEKYFNSSKVLIRKNKEELNEYFKNQGYTVFNMSTDEIVLVNNSNRYSYKANRYFLGVYSDMVTIYKTDENGNISASKLFNANVYSADGKQQKYDFESIDKGELQHIKIIDLKEKDGLVEDLIHGRKYSKDDDTKKDMEDSEECEKGEFKSPAKAFDYAMGLLKS
ncbi:hypothetical protein [Clostridium estertheticum]|uniref:Uncharacterized protein n=1 Tax=Clostridium estertheticum TaxID=238834 RepID=A0A7Y3WSZ4_9CLOT|nr:hypothetical protein [Clostridium estertheticum]MBW9171089.1 hypothetical protein [Clostridium estertheticum]MBX4266045.1 hypothetical protein [Clostridium estertheticum]NNU76470.1 hypothetical protein [Clostridium estertheticum]WBL45958.1 hypothetical protein LOR37_14865 [Clostridium estertheticum]WLC74047.1 hypothetical protein KTC99_14840 [Clostridium estertheticum]